MEPRFTRADYKRLPENFPAQLIGGRLVKKPNVSIRHQMLIGAMLIEIAKVVGPDHVALGPLDMGIDEWNVFHADIIVVQEIPPWDAHDVGIPLLVVEVLTPASARHDRFVKRRRLIAAGTKEVWIVDPDAESVDVYDSAGCRSATGETEVESAAAPGFKVVPSRLFAPPAG